MTGQDKWYTTTEVAEILKLDIETVRRYLRQGKLKGRKVGRVWRVPRSEVIPECEGT